LVALLGILRKFAGSDLNFPAGQSQTIQSRVEEEPLAQLAGGSQHFIGGVTKKTKFVESVTMASSNAQITGASQSFATSGIGQAVYQTKSRELSP
jgi:hypothetical protein